MGITRLVLLTNNDLRVRAGGVSTFRVEFVESDVQALVVPKN
jgi:hypothetical protein